MSIFMHIMILIVLRIKTSKLDKSVDTNMIIHICQVLWHSWIWNKDDPSSHQETFVCVIRGIILAFIVLSVMHELLRLRNTSFVQIIIML